MFGILILMYDILILMFDICLILMFGILILMSSILIFIWLPFLISWRPTIEVLLLITSFITYPPCVAIHQTITLQVFLQYSGIRLGQHSSLHLRHEHLISSYYSVACRLSHITAT